MPQHPVLFVHADRRAVKGQHQQILTPPGVRAAVIRIRETADPRLISIVKGRSSRPGHLHDNRLPHHLRTHVLTRRRAAKTVHTPDLVIRPCQKTRMVMVRQLIHRGLQRRSRKRRHVIPHRAKKDVRVSKHFLPEIIAVFLHPGEKPRQGFHERVIIHHRIPLVSPKPARSIPVMLRQNQCIRVRLLDRLAEFAPERVVVLLAKPKIRCDIEPPAIDIIRRGNPFCGNLQNILLQLWRVLVIQLWQSFMIPPAVVKRIVRPLMLIMELEKRTVRAVRRDISPGRVARLMLVDLFPVHPLVKGAAVIKHAVQNDPHPAFVHLLHQLNEQLIARCEILRICHTANVTGRILILPFPAFQQASLIPDNLSIMRVDKIIILDIIFMIRRGDK